MIARALVSMAEAFGTRLTEARIRMYWRFLADIPQEQVLAACARAVRECEFFPAVAVLRNFILPKAEDSALIAWAAFGQAAEDVGAYGSLDVDDPAAADAMELVFGSWSAFCAMEDGPALHSRRQEFIAAYRHARTKYLAVPPTSRRLPGMCEASGQYVAAGQVWKARLLTDGQIAVSRDQRTQRGISDGLAPQAGTTPPSEEQAG